MLDLIPESIEVDLKANLSLKQRDDVFTALAAELKPNLAIEDIEYGATWIKKFEKIDRIIRSVGFFAFLVLLVTISYLVALMVRVYIDDSQQEIEVYSLIGATRWSIYQLFLKDVFIFLTASLATSFTILFALFYYAKETLSLSGLSATFTQNLNFLSYNESAFVVFMLFIFIYANCFFTIRSSVNRLNQISHD